MSFGRDRQDTFDHRRVLGMTASRVAVERADRGQPLVPRPRAAPAIVLEVVKERADQRRVQTPDLQPGQLNAEPSAGEPEQQRIVSR